MNNLINISIVAFILSISINARVAAEGTIDLRNSCGYNYKNKITRMVKFPSDAESEMVKIIDEILSITGLPRNFKIHSISQSNAYAITDELSGVRYILYGKEFVNDIANRTGSKWSAYSIMAHEIGHHLAGHTLDNMPSRPDVELEADKFSGFIMNRLGASLEQAQAAMRILSPDTGSITHPPKHQRLAAIANGWMLECERNPTCAKNASDAASKEEQDSPSINKLVQFKIQATPKPEFSTSKYCTIGGSGDLVLKNGKTFEGTIVSDRGMPFSISGSAQASGNIYKAMLYSPILVGGLEGALFENVGYGTWTTGDGCGGVWEAYTDNGARQTYSFPHNVENSLGISIAQRMKLQNALNRLGYNAGEVDGIWGSKTRNAIMDWQRTNGYVTSGYLNDEMIDELAK